MITEYFRQSTPEAIAARQLYEARVNLLLAEASEESARCQVMTLKARIARLEKLRDTAPSQAPIAP